MATSLNSLCRLVLPVAGPGLFLLLSACGSSQHGLPDFTGLVEDAAPAIVNISGTSSGDLAQRPAEGRGQPPWFNWFREFEGEPDGNAPPAHVVPRQSLGSGFIIGRGGDIVTNNHVVANADEITVTLADHRQFKASVVGRDAASDIALLKIDAKNLPVLEWGNSTTLKVGEWVLAIGSPFGFEHTVTAGIVSGKKRALASEQYVPFLQTDVAINPGNSGGPLFNLDGEVIGINSQIFSQTGGYMGLSFAIPSDTAQHVIQQLREFGEVKRAWLGVVIQQVDAALAKSFGLEHARGALVSDADPEGPAAKAGIKAGDVILEIDGNDVQDSRSLPPLVGRHAPGDRIRLLLMRDGKSMKVQVKLEGLPSAKIVDTAADWSGLSLEQLSARQAQRLNLDGAVVVRKVQPGSPAARAGLQQGDVLVSVAGVALETPSQFLDLTQSFKPGASAALLVLREDRSLFIALERP